MPAKKFQFDCGCSFDIKDNSGDKLLIEFNPEIENLNLNCSRTWDLISSGNTKGVFQLESRLGQQKAKQLKPRNIEHLSALIAILRPGALNAIRNGKSVTDHYIDRKNGKEEVESFHPALAPILEKTYGEMIMQEQVIEIARKIAGFTLSQADLLRKSIGKKKADLMSEVKSQFLEGCKNQNIVTQEQAETIFSWIEKSSRYSFNKSHSVSYAINAYLSAYCKAHFPKVFFTSYLYYAKEKAKPYNEIKELVNNARLMDIEILPPDFRKLNSHFKLIDNKIYFGLTDIKGVGKSSINKIINTISSIEQILNKNKSEWSWLDFLVLFSSSIKKDVIEAFVESGVLSCFNKSRSEMLYEFRLFQELSKKEVAWVKQNYIGKNNLGEVFSNMISAGAGKNGSCYSKNRLKKVEELLYLYNNPTEKLVDKPVWLASIEEHRLGLPLTVSVVDSCDMSVANCTCKDFIKHQNSNKNVFIGGQIDEYKEHVIKNGNSAGQEMLFMTINDGTASLSCILFPNEWEHICKTGLIYENNKIMVSGERSKDGETLIVKKIWKLLDVF